MILIAHPKRLKYKLEILQSSLIMQLNCYSKIPFLNRFFVKPNKIAFPKCN